MVTVPVQFSVGVILLIRVILDYIEQWCFLVNTRVVLIAGFEVLTTLSMKHVSCVTLYCLVETN
jgi:hypothetical protein